MFDSLELKVLRSEGLNPDKFCQWMTDCKATYTVNKMWLDTIEGKTYLKWVWSDNEYLTFWLDFNRGCVHIVLDKTRVCYRLGPILAAVNMYYGASLV